MTSERRPRMLAALTRIGALCRRCPAGPTSVAPVIRQAEAAASAAWDAYAPPPTWTARGRAEAEATLLADLDRATALDNAGAWRGRRVLAARSCVLLRGLVERGAFADDLEVCADG